MKATDISVGQTGSPIIRGIVVALLLLAVAAGFSAYWYRGRQRSQQQEEERAREEQRKQELQIQAKALAKKHNAIVGWEADLPKRPFTMDLSRVLVNTNKQPVMFLKVYLSDVTERRGEWLGYFGNLSGHLNVNLVLSCSREQAEQLTQGGAAELRQYAVVALIEDVSRPRVISKEGDSEEVEVDISSSVFCLKGRCVEFLKLKH